MLQLLRTFMVLRGALSLMQLSNPSSLLPAICACLGTALFLAAEALPLVFHLFLLEISFLAYSSIV